MSEFTFNVEIEGRALAVFDHASEALRWATHYVYLSEDWVSNAILALESGEGFSYGYEDSYVNIVPVKKRSVP